MKHSEDINNIEICEGKYFQHTNFYLQGIIISNYNTTKKKAIE